MLHFTLTKVIQARGPLPIRAQIVSHALGGEDVAGVAAIHYSLGHVHPGAGDVTAAAHVRHFTYRAAVDTHPDLYLRMLLKRLRDLEGARAGSSELLRKTSAMPSPVGSRMSCSLGASRTCAVATTILVS